MDAKALDLKVAEKPFNPKAAAEDKFFARVLHGDGLMLLIDKPAGLWVHRGPKGGPSLEDWFDTLRYGLPRRPGLAHRLPPRKPGLSGARPSPQSARAPEPSVQAPQGQQELLGGGGRRAGRG